MAWGKIGAAAVLAVGIIGAGCLVAKGFDKIQAANRYVTVKGLAEREIPADLAIWPIRFQVSGATLADVQGQVEKHRGAIEKFLVDAGVAATDIENGSLNVNDRHAQMYGNIDYSKPRYVAEAMVLLRTTDVAKAKEMTQRVGDMVKLGVPISGNYGPEYYFTRLNDIKPEMIAQATQNAREAAEQFAKDSGSKVNGIRRAQQGLFTINPRDAYTQDIKEIRVVSTIDYYLAD